jgi:hypothetical protein
MLPSLGGRVACVLGELLSTLLHFFTALCIHHSELVLTDLNEFCVNQGLMLFMAATKGARTVLSPPREEWSKVVP